MRILRCHIFCMSLVLLVVVLCFGQEKVRQIEKRPTKNDPLELVSAEVGNKTFNNENKVLADKDWLRNLKFDVKNISNRPVVYAEVKIQIEPQGKMQFPLSLPLVFGQMPPTEFTDLDLAKLKKLKPNESVKISIAASTLDNFTTGFMPENEIVDIERVKFYFNFIIFDDGTAWLRGQQLRRNSDNKWQDSRSIPKEVSSFPFGSNTHFEFTNNWKKKQPGLLPFK